MDNSKLPFLAHAKFQNIKYIKISNYKTMIQYGNLPHIKDMK